MKTFIVTAPSRGIGAAIAHRLAPYRLAATANWQAMQERPTTQ
jgi:hypothetical protein